MIDSPWSPWILAAEDNPVPHAVNTLFRSIGDWWIWSSHQGNLVLSGIILIGVGLFVAKRVDTGPASEGTDRYVTKNRFAHMIEVICVYLRDKTVRPLLHGRTERFMPFLWTLFFFILVNNLLGMVPLLDLQYLLFPGLAKSHTAFMGGTATQNIAVTAVLALFSFVVTNVAGIKEMGIKPYFGHMTGGAPKMVAPLVFVIELLGVFIKPIALAIRLFANMTAGHILMATLFMFVGMVFKPEVRHVLLTPSVTLVSALAAIAVSFLELFVAFLQAFVFMFLTTVFISLLSHHGEGHEHGHEHGHDHGDGHGHGAHAHGGGTPAAAH